MLLSQLLDGELTPAETASLRSHADGCVACRGWLERHERAQEAGRMAMTAERPAVHGGRPGPECVAPERLAGWVERALADDDLGAVDRHLASCDACAGEALGMLRLMARLDAGPMLDVPPALRSRVAARWQAAPAERSLTALVIRVARSGMSLLERHVVAPVLGVDELPVAAPVLRADEPAQSVGFRIRAPEAEIRGTVVTEGDAVGLTLTLLGHDADALSGQRVLLRRHGRSIFSARTDAAGELRMPRIEPGVYEILCPGISTSFRIDLQP
jgi:anti-sigma factor RsiW